MGAGALLLPAQGCRWSRGQGCGGAEHLPGVKHAILQPRGYCLLLCCPVLVRGRFGWTSDLLQLSDCSIHTCYNMGNKQ